MKLRMSSRKSMSSSKFPLRMHHKSRMQATCAKTRFVARANLALLDVGFQFESFNANDVLRNFPPLSAASQLTSAFLLTWFGWPNACPG